MVAIWLDNIQNNIITLSNGSELNLSSIPGNGFNQQRRNLIRQALQNLVDVRQPLNSLPIDDPDRTTDPAKPWLFWDGTDLVGRSVIVNVSLDENNSLQLNFSKVR